MRASTSCVLRMRRSETSIPRLKSSRWRPTRFIEARSPATTESTSWPCRSIRRTRNLSLLAGSRYAVSPVLRLPLETDPVTTEPKPLTEKILSMNIRNTSPPGRVGTAWVNVSIAARSSSIPSPVIDETLMSGEPSRNVPLTRSRVSSPAMSTISSSARSMRVMTVRPRWMPSRSMTWRCSRV